MNTGLWVGQLWATLTGERAVVRVTVLDPHLELVGVDAEGEPPACQPISMFVATHEPVGA